MCLKIRSLVKIIGIRVGLDFDLETITALYNSLSSLQNYGVISRFIENVNKRRQISLCPFELGNVS